MKPVLCLVPAVVLVTACDQSDKSSASSGEPPKAIVVEEVAPAPALRQATAQAPAPRAILIAEPEVADAWEAKIPRALPVSETSEVSSHPPRARHAPVSEGLQTAGEKIEEAAKDTANP